jgi:hypothetical protein
MLDFENGYYIPKSNILYVYIFCHMVWEILGLRFCLNEERCKGNIWEMWMCQYIYI